MVATALVAGLSCDAWAEPAAPATEVAPVAALLADPGALVQWIAQHHQQAAAARARVDQARADVRSSRLLPNPSVSFNLSDIALGTTTPPGLAYNDTAIYNVQLAETVELGKRGPRIEAAQRRLEAERAGYLDTLVQTAADAREVLGRVLWLRARGAVLDETLEGAEQIMDLERSRVDHGDLSGNDFDRLTLETMAMQSDVAQNRAEFDAALSVCRSVMFAPCELPNAAGADVLASAVPVPQQGSVEALLASRPDIRQLDQSRLAAEQDATLARRRAIPDPTLTVGYTHDQFVISGDNANSLMVGVSLPLPMFDHGQHDATRALAHAAELQSIAAATLAAAHGDLASLLRRKAYLEQTLDVLEHQAIPKSKGVLDSTVTAFHRGQLSMTDLLLAQRTHTGLVLKAMDLQFEAFTVRNELRRVLGLDAGLTQPTS